jgi:DNA-binding PadR family transcriptional regulator
MSSIDLFILGFIIEKPMNAYEFAELARQYKLQEMIKISTAAIYKNMKKLGSQGYLKSRAVKQGEMAEKKIYSISEKGKKYFYQLMDIHASMNYHLYLDINSCIAHLDRVDKSKALHLLENIKDTFYKKRIFLRHAMEAYRDIPLQGRALIEQHYMVNNTLIKWIEDLIRDYKKERR